MKTTLRDVRSPDWATAVAPTSVVLFLHGYGSNEQDLSSLAAAMGLRIPWASLRAPLELGRDAAAWFSIVTPGVPDPEPVESATAAIWAWVDEHLDPVTRIVPIGFSQGGLMASQLLRTRPDRVLAPVVLGGFVLGAPQSGDDTLATLRPGLFWGRGADDAVIAPVAIARSSEFFPTHTTLEERIYPGLAHGINSAELRDVRDFLIREVGAHVVAAA